MKERKCIKEGEKVDERVRRDERVNVVKRGGETG